MSFTSLKPINSVSLSFKEHKKTNLPILVSYNPYSKSGLAQIAKFAGKVHGVVVQIKYLASLGIKSFPSTLSKETITVVDSMSLYSISASARALSLLGDQ